MAKRLTSAQLGDFARDGVCFPVRALAAQEAAWVRARFEAVEHDLGGKIAAAFGTRAISSSPLSLMSSATPLCSMQWRI